MAADVTPQELAVDDEGTRVDVTHGVDEADDATGAAQVQPVQRLTKSGQVEEGVTGEDAGTLEQPVVEHLLLGRRRVELVPRVDGPAGRAQAGQTKLSPVAVGNGGQGGQL